MHHAVAIVVLGTLASQSAPATRPAVDPPGRTPTPLRVLGRVVDGDGRPIAGAGVVAGDERTLLTEAAMSRPRALTAADGRFALEVPDDAPAEVGSDAVAVAVAAVGHATAWLALPASAGESQPAPLDLGTITLARGSELRGIVTSSDGRPIAGASVRARDLLTPWSWRQACYATQAVTQSNGRFILRGVVDGPLDVRIDADGFARRVVRPALPREALSIALEPTGFVTGRIDDPGGRFRVAAVQLLYEWSEDTRQFPVAHDSTFRVPIPFAGRFVLAASMGTYQRVAISPLLSGPATDVTLSLPDDAGCLRVRARDRKTGAAVTGFRGGLTHTFGRPRTHRNVVVESARHGRLGSAGPDGVLRVLLPEEDKRDRLLVPLLIVVAEGYQLAACEDPEPDDNGQVTVDLDPTPAMTGQVLAPDGAPRPRASVAWRPVSAEDFGDLAQVMTDADGRFRLDAPWPGEFLVQARDQQGGVSTTVTTAVTEGTRPEELRLHVTAPWMVHGHATGAPAGARLRLVPKSEWTRAERVRIRAGAAGLSGEDFTPVAKDGRFTLVGDAADPAVIALWIPSAERTGPALITEVAEIGAAKAAAEVELDLAPHAPGRIVVRCARPSPWMARLALVATRASERAPSQWQEDRLAQRRWCTATDARFELAVAPGSHELKLLDLATGVVLWQSAGPVTVAPGRDVEERAELDMVCLDLTLGGPDGSAATAEWLEIRTGHLADEEPRGHTSFHTSGWLMGGAGLNLLGSSGTDRILVPVGAVRLVAQAGFDTLERTLKRGSGTRHLINQHQDVAAQPPIQPVVVEVRKPFPLQAR